MSADSTALYRVNDLLTPLVQRDRFDSEHAADDALNEATHAVAALLRIVEPLPAPSVPAPATTTGAPQAAPDALARTRARLASLALPDVSEDDDENRGYNEAVEHALLAFDAALADAGTPQVDAPGHALRGVFRKVSAEAADLGERIDEARRAMESPDAKAADHDAYDETCREAAFPYRDMLDTLLAAVEAHLHGDNDGPQLDPRHERLAGLEAAFAAAGGRGVALAEEIDALRAEIEGDEDDGEPPTCPECLDTCRPYGDQEPGLWLCNSCGREVRPAAA